MSPGDWFEVAGRNDVEAIVRLVESAYRGEGSRDGWTTETDWLDGNRTTASKVETLIGSADSLVMIIRDPEGSDELLGCCHLSRRGNEAYFGLFAVRPAMQGRGTGRSFVDHVEKTAVELWGASTMTITVLDVRTDLICWYERLRYVRTGESDPFPTDADFGVPRTEGLRLAWMSKPLPAVARAGSRS